MPSNLMFNIILLAALWGPSFLFIKVAVLEISPVTLVALRIGLSALLLCLVLKFKKISLPRDRTLWKHCFFMGCMASGLPFILYGYSLENIDSISSALINGTTPILTIFLAHFFLEGESLTPARIMGVLLGFSGFLVLLAPSLWSKGFSGDFFGMLCSFLGAMCYAVGMVYARKHIPLQKEPLTIPTMQFISSLIYLIPLSLIIEPNFHVTQLSLQAAASIVGLSVIGTVLAFILYYRLIMQHGATAVSMSAYILPLFATLFGVLFLDETLSLHFCIATVLILFGIMIANNVIRLPFLLPAKE